MPNLSTRVERLEAMNPPPAADQHFVRLMCNKGPRNPVEMHLAEHPQDEGAYFIVVHLVDPNELNEPEQEAAWIDLRDDHPEGVFCYDTRAISQLGRPS